MTNKSEILLSKAFDYKSLLNNIAVGDDFRKVSIDKIEDIYVDGQTATMNIIEKFERLAFAKGYIHFEIDRSFEIENSIIKSIRLRGEYIQRVNLKTKKEIEQKLGKADYELTDATMWVFDFVIDSKVLVYKSLKLYLHIDPHSDRLKEVRIGDVDENLYFQ